MVIAWVYFIIETISVLLFKGHSKTGIPTFIVSIWKQRFLFLIQWSWRVQYYLKCVLFLQRCCQLCYCHLFTTNKTKIIGMEIHWNKGTEKNSLLIVFEQLQVFLTHLKKQIVFIKLIKFFFLCYFIESVKD